MEWLFIMVTLNPCTVLLACPKTDRLHNCNYVQIQYFDCTYNDQKTKPVVVVGHKASRKTLQAWASGTFKHYASCCFSNFEIIFSRTYVKASTEKSAVSGGKRMEDIDHGCFMRNEEGKKCQAEPIHRFISLCHN